MPHRICFLAEDFYPVSHGSATQLKLLGKNLARRGNQVMVVTRRISPEHPSAESMDGYSVFRVPPAVGLNRYGKFYMLPTAFLALVRKRHQYDVIIVSDFKVLGLLSVLVGKLLGKVCILRGSTCGEMDGSYAYMFETSASPAKRRIIGALAAARNTIIKRADHFLSVCTVIKDELLRGGVPEDRILEFGIGVDTSLFRPVAANEKQELRGELGLPSKFIFTYSGRLGRGKGLPLLLRVWKRFNSRHPETHLVLVGGGQGYALAVDNELQRFVRDNQLQDSVTFTGHVEDVSRHLQASDCFVFPTENEAGGNSAIEAIACGLPVVASNVGGLVDIITDGVNGLLVKNRDESEFFEAMELVLRDSLTRERFREQARCKAVAAFEVERKVELLEALCNSLVPRS